MTNKMRAIHPGEILRDELDELGLSANAFAKSGKTIEQDVKHQGAA